MAVPARVADDNPFAQFAATAAPPGSPAARRHRDRRTAPNAATGEDAKLGAAVKRVGAGGAGSPGKRARRGDGVRSASTCTVSSVPAAAASPGKKKVKVKGAGGGGVVVVPPPSVDADEYIGAVPQCHGWL